MVSSLFVDSNWKGKGEWECLNPPGRKKKEKEGGNFGPYRPGTVAVFWGRYTTSILLLSGPVRVPSCLRLQLLP